MHVLGRWLVVVATALAGLSVLPHAGAATTPARTSFVSMVGDGDSILGTRARLWRTGSGTMDVSRTDDGMVTVRVSGGASGEDYALDFAAPPGQQLQRGSYVGAQRASFRTSGRPGIDVSGDGRGCNEVTGRFTVLDAPSDLSRLWITFEQHCEGQPPALFGEVRINEPADPELLVAPDRIAWPAGYPHVDARVVPVQLFNTGHRDLTVTDATITDGDGDFSVVGNSCSTIAPGDSCAVYVGFRPASTGRRTGQLVLRDSSTAGVHRVLLSGAGFHGRTEWSLQSDSGDPVGGGSDETLDPSNSELTGEGAENYVRLTAVDYADPSSGQRWQADFTSGSGRLLLPGSTFTGATKAGVGSSTPGMEIQSTGRYCETANGSFTVRDAAYHEGRLTRFLVDFEQHCRGAAAALRGTIAWRADTDDHTGPAAVTNLAAEPGIGSVMLDWTDPADDDWADTVVRRGTGDVAPTSRSAGTAVYHGRKGTAQAIGLAAGTDYSFAVFPLDDDGNVGPASTLTVLGTHLSSSVPPRTVVAGRKTTLSGRLSDSGSGIALGIRDLAVWSAPHRSGPWTHRQTVTSDPSGHYTATVAPTATTLYRATFIGEPGRLGVRSPARLVTVRRHVGLSVDRATGPRHRVFTFSTEVFPGKPGGVVALQRHHVDGWHTVTRKTLSSTSTATFRARPNHAGRFVYRVRRGSDSRHVSSVSPRRAIAVR